LLAPPASVPLPAVLPSEQATMSAAAQPKTTMLLKPNARVLTNRTVGLLRLARKLRARQTIQRDYSRG
jgi:hypothetical protein